MTEHAKVSGLTIRQGTVYRDHKGDYYILLNHDPVGEKALLLPCVKDMIEDEKDFCRLYSHGHEAFAPLGAYVDLKHYGEISLDDLINARRSRALEDCGDLTNDTVCQLLEAINMNKDWPEDLKRKLLTIS